MNILSLHCPRLKMYINFLNYYTVTLPIDGEIICSSDIETFILLSDLLHWFYRLKCSSWKQIANLSLFWLCLILHFSVFNFILIEYNEKLILALIRFQQKTFSLAEWEADFLEKNHQSWQHWKFLFDWPPTVSKR